MAASLFVWFVVATTIWFLLMWLLYFLNRENHTDEEGVAHIWFEQQVG